MATQGTNVSTETRSFTIADLIVDDEDEIRIETSRRRGDRKYQQDAFAWARVDGPAGQFTVAAVADGMGSGAGSGVISRAAARIAVEVAQAYGPTDLDRVINATSLVVRGLFPRRGFNDNTTLVLATVAGGIIRVAWVGDSRAYVLTPGGELKLLTEDRNLGKHGLPNQLTRTLLGHVDHGCRPGTGRCQEHDPETEVFGLAGEHTARILLCTDGVNGALDDKAIGEILAGNPDPARAAAALTKRAVAAARAGGGESDNTTALLIDLTSTAKPEDEFS